MNLDILKENMKRFGTKNLSEQEVPAGGAPAVDPKEKPKGKTMAKKSYNFMGFQGKDKRTGADINNPPYSIEFELVAEPSVDASGKVTGMTKKVMADGKIIMALTSGGTLYQVFPGNYPKAMKGLGANRIAKWLMGMLATEGGMSYDRLKKGFAAKKLITDFQGPRPADLYKNQAGSSYYTTT